MGDEQRPQLSDEQKRDRVVPPRVTDKDEARRSLRSATRRVSAKTSVDVVRTVRRLIAVVVDWRDARELLSRAPVFGPFPP